MGRYSGGDEWGCAASAFNTLCYIGRSRVMTLVELHNTHIGIFGEYPHPNPPCQSTLDYKGVGKGSWMGW